MEIISFGEETLEKQVDRICQPYKSKLKVRDDGEEGAIDYEIRIKKYDVFYNSSKKILEFIPKAGFRVGDDNMQHSSPVFDIWVDKYNGLLAKSIRDYYNKLFSEWLAGL